jgi:hypothetical protein
MSDYPASQRAIRHVPGHNVSMSWIDTLWWRFCNWRWQRALAAADRWHYRMRAAADRPPSEANR